MACSRRLNRHPPLGRAAALDMLCLVGRLVGWCGVRYKIKINSNPNHKSTSIFDSFVINRSCLISKGLCRQMCSRTLTSCFRGRTFQNILSVAVA